MMSKQFFMLQSLILHRTISVQKAHVTKRIKTCAFYLFNSCSGTIFVSEKSIRFCTGTLHYMQNENCGSCCAILCYFTCSVLLNASLLRISDEVTLDFIQDLYYPSLFLFRLGLEYKSCLSPFWYNFCNRHFHCALNHSL